MKARTRATAVEKAVRATVWKGAASYPTDIEPDDVFAHMDWEKVRACDLDPKQYLPLIYDAEGAAFRGEGLPPRPR